MTMASVVDATRSGRRRRILMIVENLPVPFDRRVWAEAQSLRRAGYEVSVICPRGPFAESPFELIDSIEIHRHPLPIQAKGKAAPVAAYRLLSVVPSSAGMGSVWPRFPSKLRSAR